MPSHVSNFDISKVDAKPGNGGLGDWQWRTWRLADGHTDTHRKDRLTDRYSHGQMDKETGGDRTKYGKKDGQMVT